MKITFYFLLILFSIFSSCNLHEENIVYFEKIKKNDKPLLESDWLQNHKEKGQTLESYIDSKFNVPNSERNIIYLRPIGKFNSFQSKQISLLKEYIAIFYNLKTVVLPPNESSIVPDYYQRFNGWNQQLHAGYIIDSVLIKQIPKNAIALMAISELDIYPKDDWNYVFGLGSYRNKVGVTSIYRFNEEDFNETKFNTGLLRLLKVSTHEIGHMFGLKHCINANCLMNGSNNMEEIDSHPSRLCSLCQQKIHHNLGYNNQKRLKELTAFFKRTKIESEYKLLLKDLE